MKKIILFFSFFFIGFNCAFCQILIEGKILSKNTKEPIPFAHIYSPDFPELSTITNEEGSFLWRIPTEVEGVSISHINFKKRTLSVKEIKSSGIIYLDDNEFVLSEVTVGSLTPHSLLEKVIDKLKENHRVEPVFYDFYMRHFEHKENDHPRFLYEFVGTIFQNKNHNSSFSIFKARFFAFDKQSKADNIRTTSLHEIMTDNIFKYKEDIWDKGKLKKFILEYLDDEILNGRPAYVIRYSKKDTTSYQDNGTLFIDKETLGVSRMIMGSLYGNSFKDIYFQMIENKWYLYFVRYPRKKYNSDFFSERITMYSLRKDASDDLEFLSSGNLVRPFVSEFNSDFNDAFWENKNFIPLPVWISDQLK